MTGFQDSFDRMHLGAPPRPVPLLVRLRVLFGGMPNQMGWFLLGFGMIFFWGFVCRADLTSWYRFQGALPTAEGRVTANSDTGATEGGSKSRRGTPIYKNEFKFFVDDKEYHNASYATGVRLPVGRNVTVHYVPNNPAIARIGRMRTNVFSPMVLFVMIFPLAGVTMVLSSLFKGVKACRLLIHGVPTSGKLISKEATRVKTNGRTDYKLTFSFETEDGRTSTAKVRTNAPEKFQDEGEPLVYDPENPAWAVMLDDLPGTPRIGEDGQVVCQQPKRALFSLVIPLATFLGHGIYALRFLGH